MFCAIEQLTGKDETTAPRTPASAAIFVTDVSGRTSYCNPALCSMFGVDASAIEGLNWLDLIHPDDRKRVTDEAMHASCEPTNFVHCQRARLADGEYHWVRSSGVPQYDSDGTYVGFIGALREISGPEELRSARDPDPRYSRCKDSSRAHPLRVPTHAFAIDGVLANTVQYAMDLLCLRGGTGYRGEHDWRNLKTGILPLQCNACLGRPDDPAVNEVIRMMKGTGDSWSNIEAFEDVDFDELASLMYQGQIMGYFLSSRFCLSSGCADPRFLTSAWLRSKVTRGRDPFDPQGVIADACYQRIAPLLQDIGADYFLTDDPDLVLEARARGIRGYLMDRPWNRTQRFFPFRVRGLEEYLEKTVYTNKP